MRPIGGGGMAGSEMIKQRLVWKEEKDLLQLCHTQVLKEEQILAMINLVLCGES